MSLTSHNLLKKLPFCFNFVGPLAEKARLVILPPEDVSPYTVCVNSGVMGSDGSTSMATVCGGIILTHSSSM
jgi:polyribonucleotide nucleotidyltransferase